MANMSSSRDRQAGKTTALPSSIGTLGIRGEGLVVVLYGILQENLRLSILLVDLMGGS
jgi:hypothetical protein